MRLFIFLFCFSLILNIQAQDRPYSNFGIDNDSSEIPLGLEVGTMAPSFELKDAEGNYYGFNPEGESREKPLVLNFYRGQWCPVCVRYLSNLQDSLYLILDAGADFWAITPEMAENAVTTASKVEATFPILIDENEDVMYDYDVIFDVTSAYQTLINVGKLTSIAVNNGHDKARLPVPATYIIDTQGKIVFRQFDYNYKNRASVKDIIAVLNGLKQP